MSELNKIKNNLKNFDQSIDWMQLSCVLGEMAKHVNKKDPKVCDDMLSIISLLLRVAKQYDIDMEQAWDKWYKKAYYKTYTSDHTGHK